MSHGETHSRSGSAQEGVWEPLQDPSRENGLCWVAQQELVLDVDEDGLPALPKSLSARSNSSPSPCGEVSHLHLATGILLGLATVAVLAVTLHPSPGLSDFDHMPLMQKWLPEKEEEVLPFNEWVKAWHAKVGHLTDVVYHTYSHHPRFIKELQSNTQFLRWQLAYQCPKLMVGYEVSASGEVHVLNKVVAPSLCQQKCSEMQGCTAWTWRSTGPQKHQCHRIQAKEVNFTKTKQHDVSGRPCEENVHDYWWPSGDQDLYDLPTHQAPSVEVPSCSVTPRRQECQVNATGVVKVQPRPALPGPMSWMTLLWPFRRNMQDTHPLAHLPSDCCAPLETPEAKLCTKGSPMRSGQRCQQIEAGDYGCCPEEHVKGDDAAQSSMHCVALFRAWHPEQKLLELQYEKKAGIFACESFGLYSSQEVELFPGVVSRRVHSAMMCEIGGMFITALNLGIFLAFYRQVILEAEFLKSAWVIKVDPDTVWSPQRLRPILHSQRWGLDGDGIYLNNCHDGLHGPIEVFSTRAFLALGHNAKKCATAMDGQECVDNCEGVWNQIKVCNGPCTEWWGEDIWADQCLDRYTEAKRVFVKTLLQEAHCKPHVPDWRSCNDPHVVAFHPFKDPADMERCLEAVEQHEVPKQSV
ncbi:unnamed protein product [Durusdinium trenchii]|uniref:Uncharacterized protein n=1 Tax=Durusdinium trenchii TaxID=1381693 RepID=A0ABP0KLG4_9DINO